MELKPFQKKVLDDLESYLQYLAIFKKLDTAFNEYWRDKIGTYGLASGEIIDPYKNNVPGAANVCIKVPTAGGKTFIACNALKTIFDNSEMNMPKTVIWLVPSITILEQTIRNLSNINHPYRQKINTLFSGKVEVYTKDAVLQGAGFNPTVVSEQLSIIIMSFDSLRSRKKEDRKIYQENGQLASFTYMAEDTSHVLEDTDETALINVIRKLNPVVIVDESHNAESELSVEMLNNLNPRFVLDLTATPRDNSNIISFVNALELKKENMVKLPVIVYNHHEKSEVVNSALQLRHKLEQMAVREEKNGGRYIRPMVLFQAQPRSHEDNTTFEKLKQKLVALNIPEEQIKIKTADINELRNIDLLDRNCPVRYIITVNALKEGWDCPFAYVLASLADKTSAVDVEQILGRVLRQPYVSRHQEVMLNLSYVLTASNKFMDTLQNIIKGLNRAGFSSKDYTVPQNILSEFSESARTPINDLFSAIPDSVDDQGSSVDFTLDKINFDASGTEINTSDPVLGEIEKSAVIQNADFEKQAAELESKGDDFLLQQSLGDKIKINNAKEHFREVLKTIVLPQFYLKVKSLGVFGSDEEILLEKQNLLSGFKLSFCDININFDEVDSEMYKVDIEQKNKDDYSPSFLKLDKSISRELLNHILKTPKENQIKEVAYRLSQRLGRINDISDTEIDKYVQHIVESLNQEQIVDVLNKEYSYAERIRNKIETLKDEAGQKEFVTMLDKDRIILKPAYRIPEQQPMGDKESTGIAKSLYGEEFKMNDFEKKVINEIANLKNVLFWTRNPERNAGFRINGFLNHYPDFIVVTQSHKILVIESKGDDRDNSDSAAKLRLGKFWENKAGSPYKYFMVFDNNSIEGAHKLYDALNVIRDL